MNKNESTVQMRDMIKGDMRKYPDIFLMKTSQLQEGEILIKEGFSEVYQCKR